MGTAVLWISILFRFSYMFDLIDDLYCSHFFCPYFQPTHGTGGDGKLKCEFPFLSKSILFKDQPAERQCLFLASDHIIDPSRSVLFLPHLLFFSSLFSSTSFLTHLKTVDLVVLHSVLFFVESCVLGCFCLVCEHPFLVVFSSAKMFRSTYPD